MESVTQFSLRNMTTNVNVVSACCLLHNFHIKNTSAPELRELETMETEAEGEAEMVLVEDRGHDKRQRLLRQLTA